MAIDSTPSHRHTPHEVRTGDIFQGVSYTEPFILDPEVHHCENEEVDASVVTYAASGADGGHRGEGPCER